MSDEKKPGIIQRLFGNFNPKGAANAAGIVPIVQAYERAVQLRSIPDNEKAFIRQTRDVATGMIAYLDPRKQPQNYKKFVYFKEQYMMYQHFLALRHNIKRSTRYTEPERTRLLSNNWQSILHMRSDLVTNAQVILTLTFDRVKPIIPYISTPLWQSPPINRSATLADLNNINDKLNPNNEEMLDDDNG